MASLSQLLAEHGLIIATHNQGKLKEIQALLDPQHIQCCSAADKNLPEPVEDGSTFIENAMIKSVAAVRATDTPALADDSGIVIPVLGGAPGIYSARWAGEKKDFGAAMERVKGELDAKGEPLDSAAYFVCVLSLAIPSHLWACEETLKHTIMNINEQQVGEHNKKSPEFHLLVSEQDGVSCINIEGRAYGQLTFPPRGDKGFGYDPIFIPDGMEQTFAEIEAKEKQQISHRSNAFKGLMRAING